MKRFSTTCPGKPLVTYGHDHLAGTRHCLLEIFAIPMKVFGTRKKSLLFFLSSGYIFDERGAKF